ncbi:unnamed protein product [Ixodes pacificus]
MELDNGAAISVMPCKQYRRLFSPYDLKPTAVKLRTYTGALVRPLGVSTVNTSLEGNGLRTPGTTDSRRSSSRRYHTSFIPKLTVLWELQANQNQSNTLLEALLSKYQPLCNDELGTIAEEAAELVFKPERRPKFFKTRNVPFAFANGSGSRAVKIAKDWQHHNCDYIRVCYASRTGYQEKWGHTPLRLLQDNHKSLS